MEVNVIGREVEKGLGDKVWGMGWVVYMDIEIIKMWIWVGVKKNLERGLRVLVEWGVRGF